MPTAYRRIGLTLSPSVSRSLRVLGLAPESEPDSPTDGALQVSAALARYADAIERAGRELDRVFGREEWNLMADVLNGCADLWEWNGAGDKWFGEGEGDRAVKALLAKLAKLTPIHGDAILAAVRWFRRHPEIDHSTDAWWTVESRTRTEVAHGATGD